MQRLWLQLFSIMFLLLAVTPVRAQEEKIMQVHSGGSVVYEVNTVQVDSITFKQERLPEQPRIL